MPKDKKESTKKVTTKKKPVAKKVAVKKTPVEKKVEKKFAVIELAGSQLKIEEGQEYEVKKLSGNKGDKIEMENVLMVVNGEDIKIGSPYVEGAKVTLEITSQKKGEKVEVFKYKAKARYRRSYGHRPLITRVLVKKIK
jgi:large subunit ribosomal protein L21